VCTPKKLLLYSLFDSNKENSGKNLIKKSKSMFLLYLKNFQRKSDKFLANDL